MLFSVLKNNMFIPTQNFTLTAEFGGASTNVNLPVTNNYIGLKGPRTQRSDLLRLRLKVMENSDKIIQKAKFPSLNTSLMVA